LFTIINNRFFPLFFSEKTQEPPKGGYLGYAPIKDKFGKTSTTKRPATTHLEEAEAGYEFHVYHYTNPLQNSLPSSNDNERHVEHNEPKQQKKHEEVQSEEDSGADGKQLANAEDYDEEIDANYIKEKGADANDDEDVSGEKNDLIFNDEYKTIKTYLTGVDDDDKTDDDYFSKDFDKYYNKYTPFADSEEEHDDVKTNQKNVDNNDKQAVEEYDEVEEDDEDDDSKGEYTANDDDSHYTYASEADTDATSS
jgi:hypothetical protein